MRLPPSSWLTILTVAGCGSPAATEPEVSPTLPVIDTEPGPGALVRLTEAQLTTALRGLFGPGLQTGGPVEPDVPAAGLRQVGAARAGISGWGVEQYEALAYSVAEQAVSEEGRDWMACVPDGHNDEPCLTLLFRELASDAWRRTISSEETTRLVELVQRAHAALNDLEHSLQFGIAAVIQAPEFLYRLELGRGTSTGTNTRALRPDELATRMAFFLWNTPPDEALLASPLDTREEVRSQAARMIGDPRFRDGARAFFEDLYHLYELEAVTKDARLFVHYSSELGAEAREETLLFLEDLLIHRNGDFRDVFTEPRSFPSRRLAALYAVKASVREGFGPVTFTRSDRRRGILGQASFLMLNAHPAASSATLRGKFVREVFLCDPIPPPPAGVDTALPEPSGTAPTLRDRVVEHLENPSCAGCHQLMDPVGLGLERFDGVGRYRELEAGARIDASGIVDGYPFEDAWSLADVLRNHPEVPGCLVRSLYRYAVSREESEGEAELLARLTERFAARGHSFSGLVLDIVQSQGFRAVKESSP